MLQGRRLRLGLVAKLLSYILLHGGRIMDWLDRIVHSFIMTFGITQPDPRHKRVANLVIGFMLLAVIVVFLAIIGFGLRHLTS